MIIQALDKAFNSRHVENWPWVYIAVDLHGTIIEPHKKDLEYYKDALNVLQALSKSTKVQLILFTCSYPDNLVDFLDHCKDIEIFWTYLNGNPDIKNTKTANFAEKFFYDVLIEDKAGFDPENDWSEILKWLKLNKEILN